LICATAPPDTGIAGRCTQTGFPPAAGAGTAFEATSGGWSSASGSYPWRRELAPSCRWNWPPVYWRPWSEWCSSASGRPQPQGW